MTCRLKCSSFQTQSHVFLTCVNEKYVVAFPGEKAWTKFTHVHSGGDAVRMSAWMGVSV